MRYRPDTKLGLFHAGFSHAFSSRWFSYQAVISAGTPLRRRTGRTTCFTCLSCASVIRKTTNKLFDQLGVGFVQLVQCCAQRKCAGRNLRVRVKAAPLRGTAGLRLWGGPADARRATSA